jgi:hypothetical protein
MVSCRVSLKWLAGHLANGNIRQAQLNTHASDNTLTTATVMKK